MPYLESASSDSSPSIGMSSTEQQSPASYHPTYFTHQPYYYSNYFHAPAPAPAPTHMPPSFGYAQTVSNGFSPVQVQGYSQVYNYGQSYPLPTRPPRYSASVPTGCPTGCVSPLDLFGGLPSQQSLPTMSSMSARLDFAADKPAENPFEEDEEEGEGEEEDNGEAVASGVSEGGAASPASSSAGSAVCVEDEAQREGQQEEGPRVTLLKVDRQQQARKPKKIQPAGKAVQIKPSPLMKGSEPAREMSITDGKEGKEGKKRSRTAQACERCRIRKARCFGGNPCNRCIKRKFVCEFTPTKARAMSKAEPVKPKIRRHSMHTVSSSTSNLPNSNLKLTQSHQPETRQQPARTHSHGFTGSVVGPDFSIHPHPYSRPVATGISAVPPPVQTSTPGSLPALPLGSAVYPPPSSHIGLGLGLSLGLSLTPPPDDPEAEGDSDLDMPGMSTSTDSSASGPGLSGTSTWSAFGAAAGETYTPLMMDDEDVFHFSPVQTSSSHMEWGMSAAGSDVDLQPYGSSMCGGMTYLGNQQAAGWEQPTYAQYGTGHDWLSGQAVAGFRA